MKIIPIGKLHDIDADGYIQNPCIVPLKQEKYHHVVNEILAELSYKFKEHIHSLYIRGSVAKGIAIEFVSDIDLVFLCNQSIGDEIKKDIRILLNTINKKFNFINGIEVLFITKINIDNIKTQFLLKTQCACIYGVDIIPTLKSFKINQYAFSHSNGFYQSMIDIKAELMNETNLDEIKEICTWTMKRIIRTGFETVMIKDQSYTRDLYPNYLIFSNYYPEKEADMKLALTLAINPTSDIIEILKVMDSLVDFIKDQIVQ
jgi:hypothetical protein